MRDDEVLFGVGIDDQAVDFPSQHVRLGQLTLPGQIEQSLVGRRTPQEVGEPHGKLAVIQLTPLVLATRFLQVEESG